MIVRATAKGTTSSMTTIGPLSLLMRLTPDEARVWFRLFSALAAAWSFSRGIGTTYWSFATGVAATSLGRGTHRPRRLFEKHPALCRRCRLRRSDLGLGHSGRRCGNGPCDQDTAEHRAVFRRSIPHADTL